MSAASAAATGSAPGARRRAQSPAARFERHRPSVAQAHARQALATGSASRIITFPVPGDRVQQGPQHERARQLRQHVLRRSAGQAPAVPARDGHVDHEPEPRILGRIERHVPGDPRAGVQVELEGRPVGPVQVGLRVEHELQRARRAGQRLVGQGPRELAALALRHDPRRDGLNVEVAAPGTKAPRPAEPTSHAPRRRSPIWWRGAAAHLSDVGGLDGAEVSQWPSARARCPGRRGGAGPGRATARPPAPSRHLALRVEPGHDLAASPAPGTSALPASCRQLLELGGLDALVPHVEVRRRAPSPSTRRPRSWRVNVAPRSRLLADQRRVLEVLGPDAGDQRRAPSPTRTARRCSSAGGTSPIGSLSVSPSTVAGQEVHRRRADEARPRTG